MTGAWCAYTCVYIYTHTHIDTYTYTLYIYMYIYMYSILFPTYVYIYTHTLELRQMFWVDPIAAVHQEMVGYPKQRWSQMVECSRDFHRRLHEVERHRWGRWLRTGGWFLHFFHGSTAPVLSFWTGKFQEKWTDRSSTGYREISWNSCFWFTKFRFFARHLPFTAFVASDFPILTPNFSPVAVFWGEIPNLNISEQLIFHCSGDFLQLCSVGASISVGRNWKPRWRT